MMIEMPDDWDVNELDGSVLADEIIDTENYLRTEIGTMDRIERLEYFEHLSELYDAMNVLGEWDTYYERREE